MFVLLLSYQGFDLRFVCLSVLVCSLYTFTLRDEPSAQSAPVPSRPKKRLYACWVKQNKRMPLTATFRIVRFPNNVLMVGLRYQGNI